METFKDILAEIGAF